MLVTNSQRISAQLRKCDQSFVLSLDHNADFLSTLRDFLRMILKLCSCVFFIVLLLTGLNFLDFLTMPKDREDQRTVIKFLVAEGQSPIQIWRRLQTVFGEEALGKTQVHCWAKRFKEGDGLEPVSDKPRSGRPRTAITRRNVNRIQAELDRDRRVSVRQLVENTGFSQGTVHRILKKELKVRRISCKFVPKILSTIQRQTRVDICQENLNRIRHDPILLHKIITGDETWLHRYDPDTKTESSHWMPPDEKKRPQKALRARTVQKAMLVAFMDDSGVIHTEFCQRTVNKERYGAILDRLKDAIRQKRPGLWHPDPTVPYLRQLWFHHDNAPAHTAGSTAVKLKDFHWLRHPPTPLILRRVIFFLFPNLKKQIRGVQFDSLQAAKDEAVRILRNIPVELMNKAIQDMAARWQRCIDARGHYFEGDVAPGPESDSESDSDSDSSDDD